MTSLLGALMPSRLRNRAGDMLRFPDLMSKTSTPAGLSHGGLSGYRGSALGRGGSTNCRAEVGEGLGDEGPRRPPSRPLGGWL